MSDAFDSVGAGDPVHQIDGKWWYWTETWADENGPFETEDEARAALHRYCEEELGILPFEIQEEPKDA